MLYLNEQGEVLPNTFVILITAKGGSNQRLSVVSSTHFKTSGDKYFRVVGSKLWTTLPPFLRCLDNSYSFKQELKTPLFRLN